MKYKIGQPIAAFASNSRNIIFGSITGIRIEVGSHDMLYDYRVLWHDDQESFHNEEVIGIYADVLKKVTTDEK